jgi:hypothetical protein
MYETLNMGIVLEPKKPIGHWVSLIKVGVRKKCGQGVYKDAGYRR